MKFSIIIPVYNVENYIVRCLNSVCNQTFDDYEVILVNDGSTDKSQNIIEEYINTHNTKIKFYVKENSGLSDTRNYGLKKAIGDYIFFIDSDDYIDIEILERANRVLKNENSLDILRIPKCIVNENDKIISKDNIKEFFNITGEEAFLRIRKNRIILETACTYFFRRKFWNINNFEFAKKKVHEDIGLIPLVIILANKVSAINYPFYFYCRRENSITTQKEYSKHLKKANDMLFHYDYLKKSIDRINIINLKAKYEYILYITEGTIIKIKDLNKEDYKKYKSELIKRKLLNNIKINSIKSLLKKIYYFYLIYFKI
jgi:glycosyltransferase involved in cell wall biosynthesis